MSDNTILPERRYLEMGVPIAELCLISVEPTTYRVVFRINMLNTSKLNIRLLGRKWTVKDADGQVHIIEADHVFEQDPMLAPGAAFSYGGRHDFTSRPISMEVRFFGIDQMLVPFITTACAIPKRFLRLPSI